jgi:hypothetical protein
MGPSCEIGCCGRRFTGNTYVKLLPAMREGDKAAVPLGGDARNQQFNSARNPYGLRQTRADANMQQQGRAPR